MELGAGGAGVGPCWRGAPLDPLGIWRRLRAYERFAIHFFYRCAAFVTTDTSTELLRDLVKPAEI